MPPPRGQGEQFVAMDFFANGKTARRMGADEKSKHAQILNRSIAAARRPPCFSGRLHHAAPDGSALQAGSPAGPNTGSDRST